ncbi:monovalent cation/H+ antiporter subunit D [Rhodovulum sp. YNF3179]|uniref:monovalent cation/H+ antiporter subunit D n=1 Tax=Rhodovulum sp. YNF3179 TaxID=3425127 RepID=UPI003D324AA7
MSHWIIAPVILPALLAAVTMLAFRHHILLQRVFSTAGTVLLLAIALGLAVSAAGGTVTVYDLGNWPAPFGIVLVLDRLSALMVLLTAALALGVQLYAIGSGWDERGKHFHALFQFQLMGVCGAFLTGDAFNLFVFFEVLLIASYGLMIHGGGPRRLRAGTQYVVYNLLGSTLFLFALGTIYAVTGTLNMADLAVKVGELPADDTALIRVGAALLLLVFAVKAALLPLHFWLPESYANAPAPVAALFAIMTKVGAYAILRMYTLVFGPEAGIVAGSFDAWLMPAALLTVAVGMIGILGARDLGRLTAYAAIGSMGTLLVAVALFAPGATTAALYYMIHSTFATAALFLVADMVMERRGADGVEIRAAQPIPQNGLIASIFFISAIAMAGMPPLSGFIGKLLVLDAARDVPGATTIWAVILVTSLIAIVGLARAGSTVFWKGYGIVTDETDTAPAAPARGGGLAFVAAFGLLAPLVGMTLAAGPVTAYLDATAAQLYAPDAYLDAVLSGTPVKAEEAQ